MFFRPQLILWIRVQRTKSIDACTFLSKLNPKRGSNLIADDVLLPVCVLMCLLSSEGLSKALLQTPHGSRVLSLGLALGVGTLASGRSPCELAAELSPETDLRSSSADGGEPLKARESSDIERSRGESVKNGCR
jgi:hypothetical protein